MSKQFSENPASWDALADFASDRSYADWRNEILSFLLYAPDPRPAPEAVVTELRPAV